MGRYILGVSGASGIVLAYKALRELTRQGHQVDFVMTKDAASTAVEEMGEEFASAEKMVRSLDPNSQTLVSIWKNNDFYAPIASGSFHTDGMVILPCSMATVAAVSMGLSDSLLRRSADVTMKEKRPLILVPRETPFSTIHLENMLRLSKNGATIVPPIPAWYTHPKSLGDVENFCVGRVFDLLKISSELYPRWGAQHSLN